MRKPPALIACCLFALCLGTVLSATVGGEWISSPLASTRTLASSIAGGLARFAAAPSFLAAAGGTVVVSSASVTTDKADYRPDETVIITGAGFAASEYVTLRVVHTDETPDGGAGHGEWYLTADANGGFITEWHVDPDDSVGSTFLLTATGPISGTVSTTFTDNASANIDQCRNGAANAPNDCLEIVGDAGWANGNAGGSNSHYIEGYSIPYRAVLSDLPPNTQISIDLGYDIRNNGSGGTGRNAIDFLTHYQRLLSHEGFGHPAENVDPVSGVDFVPGNGAESDIDPPPGGPTTYAIPVPSSILATPDPPGPQALQPSTRFNSLGAGERLMSLWGGTIDDIEYVTEGNLTADNSETVIRITLTTGAGPVAVLSWGGHIARCADWGRTGSVCNSATGISGSPYHMRLKAWACVDDGTNTDCDKDLGNLGSQDRSLSADAVFPSGTIIIRKIVIDGDQGEGDFDFTGPRSGETFDLASGDEQTFNVLANFGTGSADIDYVVTELGPADGYDFNRIECSNGSTISGQGVTINVSANETVTCTFYNEIDLQEVNGRIVVQKETDPDGDLTSFEFDTSYSANFFLSDGQSDDSDYLLAPGTHSVAELTPTGWQLTSTVCTSDVGGASENAASISLQAGETVTCVFTNTKDAKLTLIKHVVNDNGGTKGVSDFPLFVNDTSVTSGVANVFAANVLLTASETPHLGYSASVWSGDCAADGTITLEPGDDKTCEITNDDVAPKLTLNKIVVNDNGGKAAESEWVLTATGNPATDPATLSGPGAAGAADVVSGADFDAGTYDLSESAGPAGYTASAWVCSAGQTPGEAKVTVAPGDDITCTITNNDQPGTLIVKKVVINDNGGTKIATDFAFSVNGSAPPTGFIQDGANTLAGINTLSVDRGTYNVTEGAYYGYTTTYDGCAGIDIANGGLATCTITNDDQPGTIVVIKNAKPANGSFSFTTTGDGYDGFLLNGDPTGDGNKNSQTLNVGTYTVEESTQIGWILTGIGGSTNASTPYDCVVTGSGGSTGVGDLTTKTATINLKNGDTVTCTFENTGQGVTRTQGFWQTHSQLADIAWFGGDAFGHSFPGVAGTPGIGDELICGRPLDTLGKVMGGFWSDIPKKSDNKKRTALDQARMQLLQQLLAAELNASAFGSVPSTGSFAAWENALCGTNQTAIQTALQQAASFNSSGDSETFTPGTSADSKTGRALADKPFWDIIKP